MFTRFIQPIIEFFKRVFSVGKSRTRRAYSGAFGFIEKLMSIAPRTKPEKIWCFYLDPYRQGLTVTGLTGLGVLTLITLVLLVIAIVTGIVLLASIVLYLLALALFLGGLAAGATLGGKIGEDGKMVLPGIAAGGFGGFYLAKYVGEFAQSVWQYGVDFASHLNLFFVVTHFIGANWHWILAFILFPAIVVFTIAALFILAVGLARGVEQIALWIYGINYPCPVCAQKTEPALYSCHICGVDHPHHLIPSQYGIFHHKCENDHKLPTMLLLGRNKKTPHRCPHSGCHTDLLPGVVGTDKHIAFVGGQTAGKTCLLVQITRHLLNLGAEIPEPDQKRDFQDLNTRMDRGQVPDKTSPKNVYRAFQMILQKGKFPYHIHFYDLAGEKFEHAQDAAAHRFFTRLDTIVFTFDPFSIPEFRNRYKHPLGIGIAAQDPLEIIRNLSQVLEKYNDKVRMKKIQLNVLLVKSDAYNIEHLAPSMHDQNTLNQQIREFMLNELGQGAFIHHIEQYFEKINYSVVSALGRTPTTDNDSPFEAKYLVQTFDMLSRGIKIKL